MRRGLGVPGGVTLVMLLCTLCLVVFAALTWASADREARLSALAAERAGAYYAADREAVAIAAALMRGDTPVSPAEIRSWEEADARLYEFSLPAGGELELRVRLRRLTDGQWEILSWRTEYAGDWEREETISIWDGGSFQGLRP